MTMRINRNGNKGRGCLPWPRSIDADSEDLDALIRLPSTVWIILFFDDQEVRRHTLDKQRVRGQSRYVRILFGAEVEPRPQSHTLQSKWSEVENGLLSRAEYRAPSNFLL